MSDTALKPGDAESKEPVPVIPSAGWWRHRGSFVWMAVEVALISASVFLGLAGQQWLEDRQHREQAREALRRFRTEIQANRAELTKKFEYHAPRQKAVAAWIAADAKGREAIDLDIQGLQPPFLEDTAWDLALATQSLSYLESDLAFQLSRIYMYQGLVDELGRGVLQAMYVNPPSSQFEEFIRAVDLYYSDLIGLEPGLLKMYDTVLPQIEAALAE